MENDLFLNNYDILVYFFCSTTIGAHSDCSFNTITAKLSLKSFLAINRLVHKWYDYPCCMLQTCISLVKEKSQERVEDPIKAFNNLIFSSRLLFIQTRLLSRSGDTVEILAWQLPRFLLKGISSSSSYNRPSRNIAKNCLLAIRVQQKKICSSKIDPSFFKWIPGLFFMYFLLFNQF